MKPINRALDALGDGHGERAQLDEPATALDRLVRS